MSKHSSTKKIYKIADGVALSCCVIGLTVVIVFSVTLYTVTDGWVHLARTSFVPYIAVMLTAVALDLVALWHRDHLIWSIISLTAKELLLLIGAILMLPTFSGLYLGLGSFTLFMVIPSFWNIARIVDERNRVSKKNKEEEAR